MSTNSYQQKSSSSPRITDNVILTCKCGNTPQFALDAYQLLFGNKLPEVIEGRGAVKLWARTASDYIKNALLASARSNEPFAYAVRGKEFWDLLKGIRIC